MGDKSVQAHGLDILALWPAVVVLDAQVTLQQSAKLERSEVDVPDLVVDLFEADVLADTTSADGDRMAVPFEAAVGADVADFEVGRIFQGWQPSRQGSR